MKLLRLGVVLVALHAYAGILPPGTYPFRTYGAESGLGNLSVMRLAQDATGFIWVATQDGVYRYDGNRFTRFGLEQGLPSTFASLLATGNDNVVWTATAGGVARFNGVRFELASDLPRVNANAIAIDNTNRLWVAMPQGLFVEQRDGGFALAPGVEPREFTSVWCTKNGDVLAAVNGSIGRFARGAWTWMPIAHDRIDALAIDRGGRLWARSGAHLWSKSESEAEFRDDSSVLPGTSNNGYLALDVRGNLYVPTDQGIGIHDENGWRVLGREEGLPTDWARDVLEDREGSIWVGSLGVHRMLGRGEFTIYRRANGLPNEVTWCFHWDRDGHLLVGTDLGLARSEEHGWSVVAGTERTQIRSVAEDEDGVLWAGGSPPTVLRIDRRNNTVARYELGEGVQARTLLRILRDRTGAIWVATRGGGVLRKGRNEERFTRASIPNGTIDEDFRDIIEDSQGRIWAAGQYGLAVLQWSAGGLPVPQDGQAAAPVPHWKRFTTRDGLARDHVAYLHETSSGDLLVAYFEPIGIARIRSAGETIRILSTVELNKVFIVGEDKQHRQWIGTGAGVDVFGPSSVDHFTASDGLAGDDTDAQAFLCDERGEVFLGTSSGFSRFVARADQPRLEAPPLVITQSKLSGRRDFDVAFSALSFFKPANIEYETRLAGLDDAWQRAIEPRARFSRLPPGDYRFEARARLRPGPWSAPVSVAFVIPPAWWQTIWAQAGAVLFVALLLFLGYRWRIAYLRRRNVELEALVEQRTHELAIANQQLLDLSVTDALTGTKNRRYLQLCMAEYTGDSLRRYESLSRAGVDPTRSNADLVFLMIDIDRFKEINDRYGHAGGDATLIGFRRLLCTIMRESDTLVRWGGEEFLFIARNTSRNEASTIAERIRTTVEDHEFAIDDQTTVKLTCSVGFAAFPFIAEDPGRNGWEDVVDVADVCLFSAKRAGRNCWVGAFVTDCTSPDTIVARVRQSAEELVASGELSIVSSASPSAAERQKTRMDSTDAHVSR
jgi:diguanylate cyclase (GGDEF)-like protein